MKIRNCTSFALALLALAVAATRTGAQSTYTPYTFTTLAGGGDFTNADGMGDAERLWAPSGVALDANGNVYVGDRGNNAIRKVTQEGVVTTLAAGFNGPSGVAVDTNGNVYVADQGNDRIRKVTPAGVVTTLASGFNSPADVAVDSASNVYVADSGNYTI